MWWMGWPQEGNRLGHLGWPSGCARGRMERERIDAAAIDPDPWEGSAQVIPRSEAGRHDGTVKACGSGVVFLLTLLAATASWHRRTTMKNS